MRTLLLALVFVASIGNLPASAADGMPAYADLIADCAASSDAACSGQQVVLASQWPKALSGDMLSLAQFCVLLCRWLLWRPEDRSGEGLRPAHCRRGHR